MNRGNMETRPGRIDFLINRVLDYRRFEGDKGADAFTGAHKEGNYLYQYEWLCLWEEGYNKVLPFDYAYGKAATILSHILNNISIKIYDQELIVGTNPRTPPSEMSIDKLVRMREIEKKFIASQAFTMFGLLPTREQKVLETGVAVGSRWRECHLSINYSKVLELGIKGIKKEIEERLGKTEVIEKVEDIDTIYFLKGMLTVYDAVSCFIRRYADEAEKLAGGGNDPSRKAELMNIAHICRRISAEPPESFYEAIQLVWFVDLILEFEYGIRHMGISPGRFDQYMYPFYKKDIDKQITDDPGVLELIECFFIKLFENQYITGEVRHITVSGKTRDGRDATNNLSFICLDAIEKVRLTVPSISIRYHEGIPEKLLRRACGITLQGFGQPSYFNDDVVIPALTAAGVSVEDARDYTIVGCIEVVIQGKTEQITSFNMNHMKFLEFAMNNGRSLLTGKLEGLETGDMVDYKCFEDLLDAYKKQEAYFLDIFAKDANIFDLFHGRINQKLFTSSLTDDCIGRGKSDIDGGSLYEFVYVITVGMVNVADALAAIKKLVFEEKKIEAAELKKALACNFEGYEPMRLQLLNKSPKYGNDDDYVDLLYKEIAEDFYRKATGYKTVHGGSFIMQVQSNILNVIFGELCGASADGRKSKTMLGDSTSPVQGRDKLGPTAAIKSLTKIDWKLDAGGQAVNMKFDPALFKGENGLDNFMVLIKTYLQRGGEQMQINIVNSEILRNAQKNPEQYRDLIVRVCGYSAHFTLLSAQIQEDIIQRTGHSTL
ncbi:MAG: pyruvate formate lyase family protein [Clostridiales bacterium]|nr:pyruvate formate lyase family protein [Clostridiales bacterium]